MSHTDAIAARQKKIVEIIESNELTTPNEIIAELAKCGFATNSVGSPYTKRSLNVDLCEIRKYKAIKYIYGGYTTIPNYEPPKKRRKTQYSEKEYISKPMPYPKPLPRKYKEKFMTLAEVEAKAREAGVSYGKYMWLVTEHENKKNE